MNQKYDSNKRDMGGYYCYSEPLGKRQLAELLDTCEALNFSPEVTLEVEWITRKFRDFESIEKPDLLSAAQRFQTLKEIERIAKELEFTLEKLSNKDHAELTREAIALRAADVQKMEEEEPGCGHRFSAAAHSIEHMIQLDLLSRAATVVLKNTVDSGAKGGRREVLTSYCRYLQELASALSKVGIKPGRGGAFERVANAVFQAANIPAKPEGAIRQFLKQQPE